MRRITREAWSSPRGTGLAPVNVKGWIVTGVGVAAILVTVGAMIATRPPLVINLLIPICEAVALVVVALLTSSMLAPKA